MAYGCLAILYLEAHGPVHEVEVQVVQFQGLQTPGAGCFHQGLLMAGAPELQGEGGSTDTMATEPVRAVRIHLPAGPGSSRCTTSRTPWQ